MSAWRLRSDGTGTPRRVVHRPLVVLVAVVSAVSAFALTGMTLQASDARATSVVVHEPTDTTVPVATTVATTPPSTVPPETTAPTTVPETTPPTDPPETSPPVTDPAWTPPTEPTWTPGSGGTRGETATATSTTVEVTMTTTQNLLVGPPPSTATTTTIPSQDLSSTTVERSRGGSDPVVWAIAAGLAVAGVVLGSCTFVYWRRTRPDDDGHPGVDGKGRSRYSDLVITVPPSP